MIYLIYITGIRIEKSIKNKHTIYIIFGSANQIYLEFFTIFYFTCPYAIAENFNMYDKNPKISSTNFLDITIMDAGSWTP